ncbi:MAG: putative toxin-antitoxin system toxin component, PIN family [Gammaproteobacteria bacterium]|nr:putative toxin-antitoxin system toxin component, PIN family [Gammaproteobacteria bacterium]
MRVVVDTSVFLPGVFFGGPPRDVLAAWRASRIEMVVSGEIIQEYLRVGVRLSARFPDADLDRVLDMVAETATLVSAPPLPEPVCEDRDDDKFLACAVAAGARYVVSSDRALLATSPYRNVTVLRSRDLLDILRVRTPAKE